MTPERQAQLAAEIARLTALVGAKRAKQRQAAYGPRITFTTLPVYAQPVVDWNSIRLATLTKAAQASDVKVLRSWCRLHGTEYSRFYTGTSRVWHLFVNDNHRRMRQVCRLYVRGGLGR